MLNVHGGIRHLEMNISLHFSRFGVHGGIRHLEIIFAHGRLLSVVHGGIRHLERYMHWQQLQA